MKTYDVTVHRDGKWWMVEIPELDGLTQARRVADVQEAAREWIAVTLDVALSEVVVTVRSLTVGAHEVTKDLHEVEHWRDQEKKAAARYSDQLAKSAVYLADEDVPMRDIGALLGVSFQRAQQLTSSRGRALRQASRLTSPG